MPKIFLKYHSEKKKEKKTILLINPMKNDGMNLETYIIATLLGNMAVLFSKHLLNMSSMNNRSLNSSLYLLSEEGLTAIIMVKKIIVLQIQQNNLNILLSPNI